MTAAYQQHFSFHEYFKQLKIHINPHLYADAIELKILLQINDKNKQTKMFVIKSNIVKYF